MEQEKKVEMTRQVQRTAQEAGFTRDRTRASTDPQEISQNNSFPNSLVLRVINFHG